MLKYSTGTLTEEQHKIQDQWYKDCSHYDYLIIGTGMSALTTGSLLANSGYKVCMLEAHDIPGGYAHSFEMNDFHFCAQVHYIWGCSPGLVIYEFLKQLGLEQEITFNSYDSETYDIAALPDGKRVGIPFGFDKLIQNVEAAYPGQKPQLEKFINILEKVHGEILKMPSGKIQWWQYLTQGYQFLNLIKYRNATLQDVYDECQLSREAQAIINCQTGDFGAPPNELSFFAFTCLFCGYNEGAYYPTKHFRYFIDRLAQFITDQPGCRIFYESEVDGIQTENGKVTSVTTTNGKRFTAETVICNMDPQKASYMIGREKFPQNYLPSISYEYSIAAFNLYLGVKGIDLREHGFGDWNVWSLGQWDINQMYKEMLEDNYQKPLIFMSTPSLHSSEPGITPEGCDILEVITIANHKYWKDICDNDKKAYRKKKRELSQYMMDYVQERYIPNLQDHLVLKVVGTPTTSEDFCFAPYGNAYGSHMTPENVGMERLKADTPWSNFFWCNASSGYAGINGTVSTGVGLYEQLTGDKVYDLSMRPTTEEAIQYAKSCVHLEKQPQKLRI